jgi:hypothetical protein
METLKLLAANLRCTDADFEAKYADLLNQINVELDQRELKKQLATYAASLGKENSVLDLSSSVVGLEGKIAFCLNHGAELNASSLTRVVLLLDRLAEQTERATPTWQNLPITSQTRQRDQYVNCYSRIDNLKTQTLQGTRTIREVAAGVRDIVSAYAPSNSGVYRQLLTHYKDCLHEAQSDPTVSNWVPVLRTVVETLTLLNSNRGSIKQGKRTARARLMSSTVDTRDRQGEAAATRIKVKSTDTDLGITSVDPTNVVGAELAVVYNTKTHHVEVYRASGEQKLSVQGARITNFDPALSQGRALREPDSWLPRFTSITTVRRAEVLMTSLKGKKWALSGKLNSNHLILKTL